MAAVAVRAGLRTAHCSLFSPAGQCVVTGWRETCLLKSKLHCLAGACCLTVVLWPPHHRDSRVPFCAKSRQQTCSSVQVWPLLPGHQTSACPDMAQAPGKPPRQEQSCMKHSSASSRAKASSYSQEQPRSLCRRYQLLRNLLLTMQSANESYSEILYLMVFIVQVNTH